MSSTGLGARSRGSPWAALVNARRLLEEAARQYVDAVESGQSASLAGLQTAARLRLAAKTYVHAERVTLEIDDS